MANKNDIIVNNENALVEITNKSGVEKGVETILMQNRSLLPENVSTERIINAAGFYIANRLDKNGSPELLNLDKSAKLQMLYGVLKEAEVGLEAGADYDIVVFKGKPVVCRKKEGWFKILDLIKPAEISKFVVNVATIGDVISYNPVSEEVHHVLKGEKGQFYNDITAAYAYIKFVNGFEKTVFLDKSDIDHIKRLSPSGGSDYSPWNAHAIKMVKTKVAKELAKELKFLFGGRLSSALQQAIDSDDEVIGRISNDGFISPPTPPRPLQQAPPTQTQDKAPAVIKIDGDTGELLEEVSLDDL